MVKISQVTINETVILSKKMLHCEGMRFLIQAFRITVSLAGIILSMLKR